MEQFRGFVNWYINYIDVKLCMFVSIVAGIIFVLGLCLRRIIMKNKQKGQEISFFFAFFLFSYELSFILSLTLSGRENVIDDPWEIIPFASWVGVFLQKDIGLLTQILANILLFIPLGFLLPCCFARCRRYRYTILSAAILSLVIELIQGIAQIGLFETDDIIHNTLGACIGAGMYAMIRYIRKSRMKGRTLS